MQRLSSLAIGWLLVCAGTASAGSDQPDDPAHWEKSGLHPASARADHPPPADDRGFDVQHYDLDLEIDPEAATITGTVTITLQVLRDDLSSVHLDLVPELSADSLSWRGQPLEFSHTGDTLLVDLPAPLPSDTQVALAVR